MNEPVPQPPQPQPPPPGVFARKVPMVLSFICPGGGQFAQKRWFAATFYMTVFMGSFVYLAGYTLYHVFSNLNNVMTWDDPTVNRTLEPVSFVKVGGTFLLALVSWIAGMIDTYLADQRKIRAEAAAKLATKSIGST